MKHAHSLLLGAGIALLAGAAVLPKSPAEADSTSPAAVAAMEASAPEIVAVASEPVNPRRVRVEAAMKALKAEVGTLSHADALETAFGAYYTYQAEHPDEVRKPYLYFVDYGLSNSTPRGYVFDMEKLTVVEGPFTVAHGRGSSKARNGVPTKFSNVHGSAASSLGLYVAQETYGFSGKSAGVRYRSIGLRMRGVSGKFNNNARSRGVVAHGAPYVSARAAGRSEGCPAMEERRAQRLIPMIANGGMVFLFAPDSAWMTEDPWISAFRAE